MDQRRSSEAFGQAWGAGKTRHAHVRCAARVGRSRDGRPESRSAFVEAELFPELEALLCAESASLDESVKAAVRVSFFVSHHIEPVLLNGDCQSAFSYIPRVTDSQIDEKKAHTFVLDSRAPQGRNPGDLYPYTPDSRSSLENQQWSEGRLDNSFVAEMADNLLENEKGTREEK